MQKLFIPSIVANGVLWLVALAMQIGGWVNQGMAISLLVIAFIWTVASIIYWFRCKKRQRLEDKTQRQSSLTEILVSMHKRMMQLTLIRMNQKISQEQFDNSAPLMLDKLGLVKIADYEDFKTKVTKKLRRSVPKSPEKRESGLWRFKVIGKADEIKWELIRSKKWKIEDMVKAGECLDSLHIGIGEIIHNDKQWLGLLEELKTYMAEDQILRELIYKHLSYSYACSSALLEQAYSKRLRKNNYDQIAHSVLVESGLTPEKIELELSEMRQEISDRTKEICKSDKTNVKDTKIKLDAEHIDKAIGMDINNVPTDLSDVQIDVKVKNANEATGLRVTAQNTQFALSSKLIMCSCGELIRSVTTCGYEPVVKCPKCGKEYSPH